MNLKEMAKIDLIKELGLENLPKEKQEEMLIEIGNVVQQRIIIRISQEMPEENKAEFEKIMQDKKDQPEEIEKFIKEKVPTIDDIVAEEIGRYKQEIMDLKTGINEKPAEEK